MTTIKVILIGEPGVGKTSIIKVSTGEEFNESENPNLSVSFYLKKINLGNKQYNLELWDTIGQENLRVINALFYNNSRIVIFVYDITSKKSFNNLKSFWINEIKQQIGDSGYVKAIIGNKIDLYLKEEVNEEEAENLAKEINGKFFRMSAKVHDSEKMEKFFEELLSDYEKLNIKEENNRITLTSEQNFNNKTNKKCC